MRLALAVLLGIVLVSASGPTRCLYARPLADAQVEEVGNDARAWLEHVNEFLKNGQWDDAVDTLRRAMESRGDALIRRPVSPPWDAAGFSLFVPLRQYCQMELASWHVRAPEALAVYRQRVDSVAARWLAEATAAQDQAKLQRLVDELLLSSHADQALLRLGEMALERGNYTLARRSWEQISPQLRTTPAAASVLGCPPGRSWWSALAGRDLNSLWPELLAQVKKPIGEVSWPAYPDTDIPLAKVRAYLVLVSILEGSHQRAQLEWDFFRRLHPDAEGQLGGRRGKYHALLSDLLRASESWPGPPQGPGWPTLGGSQARMKLADREIDIARRPIWRLALPRIKAQRDRIAGDRGRVAERAEGLLSYHVAVQDGLVFIHQPGLLRAIRLATGEPAFPLQSVSRSPADLDYGAMYKVERAAQDVIPRRSAYAGVPRYCVTAVQGRLFSRMGTAWTGGDSNILLRPEQRSSLVGIDLRTQKLLFDRISPPEPGWEFEAAPIADTEHVYASMRRRNSANSQVRVVSYAIGSGELAWQRDIVRAEATNGVLFELSNSALSLRDETLFYNTNLGAIAALRTSDGRIEWLCLYPRSGLSEDDPTVNDRHLFRDLNPCLLHAGAAIAAPADCDRIFALDSAFGQVIWTTAAERAIDAVHLLGIGQGRLVASGDYLYWIDAHTGTFKGQFPAPRDTSRGFAGPSPRGYGRGVLAGHHVYWPTRDKLYVFDQRFPRQVRQPIELTTLGVHGGNLIIDSGVLLIASADALVAFNESGVPGSLASAAKQRSAGDAR